jgi:hypothetical protein
MTKQMLLSKLFSLECEFSMNSNYGTDIHFYIGKKEVAVYDNFRIYDESFSHISIEFCEIKDIKITEKTVTFILQDGGYNFKDGSKKVIRRN